MAVTYQTEGVKMPDIKKREVAEAFMTDIYRKIIHL